MCICICTGKGIPNRLSQHTMAAPLSQAKLQPSSTASEWYSSDLGTVLSGQGCFGIDPFTSNNAKLQREAQFTREVPDLQLLLSSAVNGDPEPLQVAVLRLIELTMLSS